MLGYCRKRMHAAIAEARLQALDQRRQRITTSTVVTLAEQAGRTSWKPFQRLGSQADRLDGGGQFEPLQALDEDSGDPFRVTRKRAKTEGHDGGRVRPRNTFMRKLEATFTDAPGTGCKPATQDGDQATPGKTESDRILDPRRQFQPFGKALRKNKACPGVWQLPERTRQISDKSGAEPTRQARTWQAEHIAEQARTKTSEACLVLSRKIEDRQRQSAETLWQLIDLETGHVVTGQCQPLCGEWRWRQRRLGDETLLGTASHDAFEENRGATEET